MSKNIETLFELLNEYKVEVPIVQRDYAQGRKDSHAKMVRFNLLKDMKSAILGKTPALDLNFVYGKAENGKFIPLDGQQRLITLFLLYIYAYYDDDSKTELFKKFTYETRKSSRDFLEKLIENRKSVFMSHMIPSKEIKDTEWFISSWKYDPTIESALVMLDDIKETFNDVDDLPSKISGQEFKPITFKFLDIDDIGMEDSLYIKLNARGKPLTSFENFKARLIGRLKELNLSFSNEFEHLFDCQWTDLFWSNSKKNFDQTYLAFFGVLLMNKEICDNDADWTNTIDFEKINSEIFETAYYTLNFLVNNPDCHTAYKLIFNSVKEKHTYQDRVLFHAVTTYLYMSKGSYDDSLIQWLRILKNLTLNTQIDTSDLYKRAIYGINKLADDYDDLLSYFSNEGEVAGFSKDQIREEQIKGKIIENNNDFAQLIYKAEEHPYFNGQIRSALYYGKNDKGQYDIKNFEHYWNKISKLFDDNKPQYGNLMRQALLTFGDYTLPVGEYKTLCVDDPNESSSTPSMKRLFSNHGELLKQFLDGLDIDTDIEEQINDMIKKSNVPKNDWRYCFIEYPELFTWMSTSHLRIRQSSEEVIIIPNKSSSGFNYNVFLSALYLCLKDKEVYSKFWAFYGADGDRWLEITSKNLNVRFKGEKFTITNNKDEDVLFVTKTDDPIQEVLKYIIK